MTHAQELAKYGEISWGYNISAGASNSLFLKINAHLKNNKYDNALVARLTFLRIKNVFPLKNRHANLRESALLITG